MRIVNWVSTPAEDNDSYFKGLDETISQEILMAILSMDDKQQENRWEGDIIRKPKLGLVYVELRKNLNGGECQGLLVIGRSEKDRKIPQYTKFRPGKAKLSLNGTAYFTPFELKEMSLAVAEAEAVWDYATKNDQLKFGSIER